MGINRISVATLESNSLGAMYLTIPLGGVNLITQSKCPNQLQDTNTTFLGSI